MVAINLEGFLVNFLRTFARTPDCLFSISIKILLEEMYAISIPEKNADRIRQHNIINISSSIITNACHFPVSA
jgi:hypothetical protein